MRGAIEGGSGNVIFSCISYDDSLPQILIGAVDCWVVLVESWEEWDVVEWEKCEAKRLKERGGVKRLEEPGGAKRLEKGGAKRLEERVGTRRRGVCDMCWWMMISDPVAMLLLPQTDFLLT